MLKINEGSVFNFQAINKNAVAAEQITAKLSIFRATCKPQHPVKGKLQSKKMVTQRGSYRSRGIPCARFSRNFPTHYSKWRKV